MAIKKINTDLQIEAGLLDGDGNSGTNNQILISTGTGIDWVNASTVIGGPYLPLSAGTSYPLTGVLYIAGTIRNNSGDLEIRNQTASGYATATKLMQQTVNGLETFLTLDGTSRNAYFTNQGNVGIGTTSPSEKLEVNGNILAKDSGVLAGVGGDKDGFIFHDLYTGSGNYYGYKAFTGGNTRLSIVTDASERLTVLAGGNVGIGTTNPTHKLTVNAPNDTTAVGIDFPSAHFDFSANSTSGYTTSFHMDDTATTIGSNSAGRALIFQTNNTDRLYINGNTGNVGIGTTSPAHKLDIAGTSNQTTLLVNSVNQNGNEYSSPNKVVNFTRTVASHSNPQWFKVISVTGSPRRIKISISSTGDNTNTIDQYLVSTSGYGMQSHILRLPGSKYNTSKLVSILADNPTGSTQDVWIKLEGMSSTSGVTTITANCDLKTSTEILSSATTTKPTLNTGQSELEFNANIRNKATIMTSAGATFNGNVGIGTSEPTRKLNVNGNAGINNQLLLDSPNYGEHLVIRRGIYGYDTIITGTRVDYSPTADTNTFKFLADLQTTGQLNVTDNAVIGGNISLTGGGTIEAPSSSGNEDLNLKAAGKIDVVIDSNGNSGDDQTFRVLKHSNSVLFTVAETGNATFTGDVLMPTAGQQLRIGSFTDGAINNGEYANDDLVIGDGSISIYPHRRGDYGLNESTATSTTFRSKLNIWSDNEDHITFGGASTHLVSAWESWKTWINNDSANNGTFYLYHTNAKTEFARFSGDGTTSFITGKFKATKELAVSSVAATNGSPATDNISVSGYGLIGNRTNLYITNASTNSAAIVQIGVGGVHNAAAKLSIGVSNSSLSTNFKPGSDSAYDIGSNASRWANVYADNFYGDGSNITGVTAEWDGSHTGNASIDGDLTVTGKITAQEFHTEFVSASILYDSGSTKFGDTSDDNHNFTGSVNILGSVTDLDPEDFNNALTLTANVGNGPNERGAGLFFKQRWFGSSTQVISVGGISGVKTGANGTYGGGLAFFAQPNGAGDAEEVMRFDHSGNVGIGTTSPGKELDVLGTIRATDAGGTSQHQLRPTQLISYGTAAIINAQSAGSDVRLNTQSSTVLIAKADGNVGIGTASPSVKLHVEGTGGELLRLDDTDGSYTALTLYNGATSTDSRNWGIYNNGYSYGDFNIVSSTTNSSAPDIINATRLTVNKDGNVGIGTHIPGAKLNVAGDILIDSGEYISWGTVGATSIEGSTASNKLQFRTSSTDRMIINDTGVGIGTTSPGTELDVRGTIRSMKAQTTAAFTNPFLKLFPTSTTNTTGLTTITLGTSPVDNYGVSLSGWRYGADGTPKFVIKMHNNSAAGLDALTVDHFGNVGIGTTSPSSKLDVNGTGTFRGNLDIYKSNAKLTVNSTGTSEQAGIDVKNGTLHARWILDSDDLLRVYNQTSSFDAFAIKSSGNVGIGTPSPSEKLDVRDGTITSRDSGNVNYAELDRFEGLTLKGNGAGAKYITTPNTDDLGFKTNNAEKMRITSGGNVGIGTTTPSSKLEVYGSGSTVLDIQGSQGQLFSITDDLTGTLFAVSDISGVPIFAVEADGEVSIDGDLKIKSANITYQENIDVDSSAAETIATVNTGEYTGAFFDYTCVSGSNARVGTVMAISVGGSIEFTDNSTTDIGDTSGAVLSVDISGGSMRLRATTTTDDWIIKTLIRTL
jgi:hypothetical protein